MKRRTFLRHLISGWVALWAFLTLDVRILFGRAPFHEVLASHPPGKNILWMERAGQVCPEVGDVWEGWLITERTRLPARPHEFGEPLMFAREGPRWLLHAKWAPDGPLSQVRRCADCGKRDRDVNLGFERCRPCFDSETKRIVEVWGTADVYMSPVA